MKKKLYSYENNVRNMCEKRFNFMLRKSLNDKKFTE